VLALCRRARGQAKARHALERWDALQLAPRAGGAQWRFLRRAYERAREAALPGLLMQAELNPHRSGRQVDRVEGTAGSRPTTRVGVLMRRQGTTPGA
jgi:hypothetical protein